MTVSFWANLLCRLTVIFYKPSATKDAISGDCSIRGYSNNIKGISWVSNDDSLNPDISEDRHSPIFRQKYAQRRESHGLKRSFVNIQNLRKIIKTETYHCIDPKDHHRQ